MVNRITFKNWGSRLHTSVWILRVIAITFAKFYLCINLKFDIMDLQETITKFEFFSEEGGRSITFNIGTYFQDFDFSQFNIDEIKRNVDKRNILIGELNKYLRKVPSLSAMTQEEVGDKVIHWKELTHWDAIIHNDNLNLYGHIYCKCRFSAYINEDWCGPFNGHGEITW